MLSWLEEALGGFVNLVSCLGVTLQRENCHRFFLSLSLSAFSSISHLFSVSLSSIHQCLSQHRLCLFIQHGTFLFQLSTAYTHNNEFPENTFFFPSCGFTLLKVVKSGFVPLWHVCLGSYESALHKSLSDSYSNLHQLSVNHEQLNTLCYRHIHNIKTGVRNLYFLKY